MSREKNFGSPCEGRRGTIESEDDSDVLQRHELCRSAENHAGAHLHVLHHASDAGTSWRRYSQLARIYSFFEYAVDYPSCKSAINMNITELVLKCLAEFRVLVDGTPTENLMDEHSRFKIWIGNVSAHRPPTSQRSLEYRLRDSQNLRTRVVSLLTDLLAALQVGELSGIENSLFHRFDTEAGISTSDTLEAEDVSIEDSEEDELVQFEYDAAVSSATRNMDEIHNIINLLYRFSVTLRNPAGHSRLQAAQSSIMTAFYPSDLSHVTDKFPSAAEYLARRLARAISSRRQYFHYREEHKAKLGCGLQEIVDDDTKEDHELATTAATTVYQGKEDIIMHETETVYSMTSFANSDPDSAFLRPPQWPTAGQTGDHFECPICFGIIATESEEAWRRHVYEDILPYVCTEEDCVSANTQYTRRRDWQRHHSRSHCRQWRCPMNCSIMVPSLTALDNHLRTTHGTGVEDEALEMLADACVQPLDPTHQLQCPLCRAFKATTSLWYKHVGHHLEQLALFSLPLHVRGDEINEINETDVQDSDCSSLKPGEDKFPPDSEEEFVGNEWTSILFVDNLSSGVDSETLTRTFRVCGAVVETRVFSNPETNASEGFAYVKMASVEEARAAMRSLQNTPLHGRSMRLSHATRISSQKNDGLTIGNSNADEERHRADANIGHAMEATKDVQKTSLPQECPLCLRSYIRASDLMRHLASVHEWRRYECEKCGREFTRRWNRDDHQQACRSNQLPRHDPRTEGGSQSKVELQQKSADSRPLMHSAELVFRNFGVVPATTSPAHEGGIDDGGGHHDRSSLDHDLTVGDSSR